MVRRNFTAGVGSVVSWIMLLGLLVVPRAAGQGADSSGDTALPAEKQTTPGLYVTAKEAYAKWAASPSSIKVIDVRTPEEVLFVGRPAMAWNVPVNLQTFEWDSVKHRFPMRPNPDFIPEIEKIAGHDDTLLVMCRSGSRSAKAVNQLAKAGFKHVYSITDGMEGDEVTDPGSVYFGQRVRNGWKNSGLPWTYDVDPGRMALPRVVRPGDR